MNKKLIIAGAIGAGMLATAAIAVPAVVFADEATQTTTVNTFVQKLAEKLGLSQDVVQTAVDSVHTEVKTERDAEYTANLTTAVTDGKLTQRQSDILSALKDIQPGKPTETGKPDFSNLTQEERQATMQEMNATREQAILDALNAKGLNVTADELQATQEAARTAGLKGGFGGPGGRGGHGFGMM